MKFGANQGHLRWKSVLRDFWSPKYPKFSPLLWLKNPVEYFLCFKFGGFNLKFRAKRPICNCFTLKSMIRDSWASNYPDFSPLLRKSLEYFSCFKFGWFVLSDFRLPLFLPFSSWLGGFFEAILCNKEKIWSSMRYFIRIFGFIRKKKLQCYSIARDYWSSKDPKFSPCWGSKIHPFHELYSLSLIIGLVWTFSSWFLALLLAKTPPIQFAIPWRPLSPSAETLSSLVMLTDECEPSWRLDFL